MMGKFCIIINTLRQAGFLLGLFLDRQHVPLKQNLNFQRTTWRYIPEDWTLHNHRCDSLKSSIPNRM
jgi:hypothetical protein